MATYTVVAKGALDPDDIREAPAGSGNYLVEADKVASQVDLQNGDKVYFASSVDSNVQFVTSSPSPIWVDFSFQVDSGAGGYDVTIGNNINADITVDPGTNISDVNIKASNADSVTLTGGNDVRIGYFEGSASGDDTLVLGTNSIVYGTINTGTGGTSNITIGDGSLITGNIVTGNDVDTIDLGTTEVLGAISTNDGDDAVTVGGHVSGAVNTGRGDDDFNVEDGARIDGKTDTSDGNDEITIGTGVTFNASITAGTGNDTITAGDNNTFNTGSGIKLGAGDDTLLFGDGNTINSNVVFGDGTNSGTFGADTTINGTVDGGNQSDTLEFGDNTNITGDIRAFQGDDSITFGDGGSFNKLQSGDGKDTIVVGENVNWATIETGNDADAVIVGLFDESVTRVLDGGNHDGGDGDTTNDDTLSIQISQLEQAAFKSLLESEGYVYNASTNTYDVNDSVADYHINWGNTQINDWESIQVVCFARGTLIETDRGEVAIEHLVEGDMVRTLDNGFQPIRWIRSSLAPAFGNLAPIRIAAGTFGNRRDLLVSPQHRIMLSGWQMELLFAEPEVLAPAKSLINDSTIRSEVGGMVVYYHMLFDRHEIVFAEGAPSESFHPGQTALDGMDEAVRDEIFTLFPELRNNRDGFGPAARICLKHYEAQVAMQCLEKVSPDESTVFEAA